MAVSSSVHAAQQFAGKNPDEFREFLGNAVYAVELKRSDMKARAQKFLRFCDAWAKVMPRIEGELV